MERDRSSWTRDGCLEPLAEIEEDEDEIVVTIDLPYVEKENITINATEDGLEINARMNHIIEWRYWGVAQREITFKSFKKYVTLPSKVRPEGANSSFKNGILRITLPKVKRKFLIPIE